MYPDKREAEAQLTDRREGNLTQTEAENGVMQPQPMLATTRNRRGKEWVLPQDFQGACGPADTVISAQ